MRDACPIDRGRTFFIFGNFLGFCFYHHDRIFGPCDNEINVAFFNLFNIRVDQKLTIDPAYDDSANRPVKRYVRQAQCSRRSNHCCNFRRAILIHAHDDVDHLNIVSKTFGKKRTNGSVRQSAGQNRFLTWSSLSFDKTPGDFPYSV